ncbi:hypothetical protein GLOIN_2v1781722 [Rhizophagus irregularis DAOM 181602=DAOM 197198]|uniref:Uncharacterized protein n=3 Tax=Rhizophagus irregularis TaxID=588596 RepID=A0A2P4PJ64_RHIID|nr:hypothetical protein GLOIN_2v1781722 [Rhizophagus irregularis DAOM 181602=DAOM 197198]POG65420.1 hypothetical protein GLOIN_2v1781722 [Rhizophagus irregularis DAOM 181602=DAOM 197198]|eukprot:XP_025172286.1 hypothetical protein GLOIN_2v1781722 [Rhizophagus irregularis DAOM 181602=DAOM 197198]
MSKSVPFVRKWSDAHSEPQYFNTQEDLEKHVFRDHVKSTELSSFIRVYRCIWEGCKEQLSNITKLEDYKRDDNRYYGKSNDEIIWETLWCYYNDPKKVVVFSRGNKCKNSSAKNSLIVSTSMGPFKTTGILGPEIDLVAAADASAEITPYLLICGIYNNRLLVNNKNFKNG